MKTLNLERLHEICNLISQRQDELAEDSIYVELLGLQSEYSTMSFEMFLSYYSFRIEDDSVVVFNIDGVPYESYNNNDFSEVPFIVLDMSDEGLNNWLDRVVAQKIKDLEFENQHRKEGIKRQIEMLQKQLEQ